MIANHRPPVPPAPMLLLLPRLPWPPSTPGHTHKHAISLQSWAYLGPQLECFLRSNCWTTLLPFPTLPDFFPGPARLLLGPLCLGMLLLVICRNVLRPGCGRCCCCIRHILGSLVFGCSPFCKKANYINRGLIDNQISGRPRSRRATLSTPNSSVFERAEEKATTNCYAALTDASFYAKDAKARQDQVHCSCMAERSLNSLVCCRNATSIRTSGLTCLELFLAATAVPCAFLPLLVSLRGRFPVLPSPSTPVILLGVSELYKSYK